jgi:hypothetical protein
MKGLLPYGEIYLCIVRDGILEVDGKVFEVECADGKYYVSAVGRNQFLLIEGACQTGVGVGGTFRVKGYIHTEHKGGAA